MSNQPPFDLVAAHKYFSAECFNRAWDFIDKPTRTSTENEQMLLHAFAALFHWTQRPDCTPENRSVSLWQISRVYALLDQPDNARQYAEQCHIESDSPDLPSFCLGYAYEALARAEMLAGNWDKMQAYLELAHPIAEKMEEDADRNLLLNDLATIQSPQ
jgi:hypothetical protein